MLSTRRTAWRALPPSPTHHRVVRVRSRHGSGGLGGELIEFGRRDALVHAGADLLSDDDLGEEEKEPKGWGAVVCV